MLDKSILANKAAIDLLFGSHQYYPKRWGEWKQKELDFLKKKRTYILPVSYLTCTAN